MTELRFFRRYLMIIQRLLAEAPINLCYPITEPTVLLPISTPPAALGPYRLNDVNRGRSRFDSLVHENVPGDPSGKGAAIYSAGAG